jgi:hypothetical protein
MIFIGYKDNVGSSSAYIRNKSFIEANDIKNIYWVNSKRHFIFNTIVISKFIFNIYKLIGEEYIVSTNPKWLAFLVLLSPKRSTLFLGDPLVNDSSRRSTLLNIIYDKLVFLLKIRIITASPFVYTDLEKKGYMIVSDYQRKSLSLSCPTQKSTNKIKLIYPGDMNGGRDLGPLQKFISPNFCVDVYGECSIINDFINANERIGVEMLQKLIPSYHCGIIELNKKGNQLPGKYYDFYNTNFPFLVIGNPNHLTILETKKPPNYLFIGSKPSFTNIKTFIEKYNSLKIQNLKI